jgi:hypothetical protein
MGKSAGQSDADSRFVVTNPSESFRRVLTITGLCDLFGVDDRAARKGALSRPSTYETTPAGGDGGRPLIRLRGGRAESAR